MRSILFLAALLPVAVAVALLWFGTDRVGPVLVSVLAVYYAGVALLVWRRRAAIASVARRWSRRSPAQTEPERRPRALVGIGDLREVELSLAELRSSTTLARSSFGLDVLAYRATRGRATLQALRRIAELAPAHDAPDDEALVWPSLSPHDAVALARMLHVVQEDESDIPLAIAILERLRAQGDSPHLGPHDNLLLPMLLLKSGQRSLATSLFEPSPSGEIIADQLRADLLNPFTSDVQSRQPDSAIEPWLLAVNSVLATDGLEPVALRESIDGDPFDHLDCTAAARVAHSPEDPLVTVVMTTFRPGREAISAVRSVLAQSWSRWELLVVDDASGPDSEVLLSEIASMDARITVRRSTENRGTYACRNLALDEAHGDFVTVLDADDWMHPRRLEVQARHLQSDSSQLANVTDTFRVTQDLAFLHDRGPGKKLCEPALMFRRRELLERVGYYHEARKGADSELRWRIGVVQGFPVAHLRDVPPVTLQRFDTSSLSGGDFVRGWVHPARVAYRSAWWEWHEQNRRTPRKLRLDRGAAVPFPVPSHMSGTARSAADLDFDVVLVLDISNRPSLRDRQSEALKLLHTLRRLNARVGLLHSWILAEEPGGHLLQAPAIQSAINSGTVAQVFEAEPVRTGLVLASSESELRTRGALPPAWEIGTTALLTEDAASVDESSDSMRRIDAEELPRVVGELVAQRPDAGGL